MSDIQQCFGGPNHISAVILGVIFIIVVFALLCFCHRKHIKLRGGTCLNIDRESTDVDCR